jgi:hypothetical protein
MNDFARLRCFNHNQREAVARCPACERHFCRECVTEHEDRVLCAACLKTLAVQSDAIGSTMSGLMKGVQFLLGGWFLWLCFYYLGQLLLMLPSSFHEGTLWQIKP